jgi:hypothetical protein
LPALAIALRKRRRPFSVIPLLEAPGDHRAFHRLGRELSTGEEARGIVHAAHVQAVRPQRLEAFAEDALRAAAADVYDEPSLRVVREVVGDTEVDQARLLRPRDHLDRAAERLARSREERPRVPRKAQGARADGPDARSRDPAQSLAEALDAGERALLGLRRDELLRVESLGERDPLAPAVDDPELVADERRDHEVEAVRAEIDSGERVGTGGLRHPPLLAPGRDRCNAAAQRAFAGSSRNL